MATRRRTYRVAERVKELIAKELLRVADPRFSLVTVTSAVVSPDLRKAKIYWIVTGGREREEEVNEAFEGAAGLFSRALAKDLGTRFTPELEFFYDDTLDTVDELERLFKRIHDSEQSIEGSEKENQ